MKNSDNKRGVEIAVEKLIARGCETFQFSCRNYSAPLFENQYRLTDGMTYNSYVILDEKTAVFDTVDHAVQSAWMDKLLGLLDGRHPDYLILQHLEPDHSAAISDFISQFPSCTIVCSTKAQAMLPAFLGGECPCEVRAMKENEELSLGKRTLKFFAAPMVHWPEVMMSYDLTAGILFCADAFGTFGCGIAETPLSADRFEEWMPEARRYYYNICGKYGVSVAGALRKAGGLEISWLCPLHGPAIPSETIPKVIEAYQRWSQWGTDHDRMVFIAAASLHGFTLAAARELAAMLEKDNIVTHVADMSTAELSDCVAWAFAAPVCVFACSTYDGGIMPSMASLISRLKSKAWQNRKVGIIENGSWAPAAARLIKAELANGFKDIEILEPTVSIKTRMDSTSRESLRTLCESIENAL